MKNLNNLRGMLLPLLTIFSMTLVSCGSAASSLETSTAVALQPAQPTQAASPLPPTPISASPTQADAPMTAATGCSAPAKLTIAETEGPFFKAGSPERASLLEPTTQGVHLALTGRVFSIDCTPVANALLDFWQADANGQYDNSGYTLRGHTHTDSNGFYQLTTVVPGLYTGRTEHIHVKVQAPGGPLLTTQLFFPGVAENQSDGIFDSALLMNIQKTADGESAMFNFVINLR